MLLKRLLPYKIGADRTADIFIHETTEPHYENLYIQYRLFIDKLRENMPGLFIIASINHKLGTTKNYIIANEPLTLSSYDTNKIVKAAVVASEDKKSLLYMCNFNGDICEYSSAASTISREDVEFLSKLLVVDEAIKLNETIRECICGKKGKLLRCSRCKLIYYCGVACQRKDFSRHSRVCNQIYA